MMHFRDHPDGDRVFLNLYRLMQSVDTERLQISYLPLCSPVLANNLRYF